MLPLVGRDHLVAAVVRSVEADHVGVLLTGESGVGKTRVASEVVDRIAAAGRPALHVAALGIDEVPLGALARALPDGAAYSGLSPNVSLKRYLDDRDAPTIALVDDADLLDSPTVASLVDAARSGSVQLIVTLRSARPIPTPIERCLVDGSMVRIECPPLDASSTAALAHELLGAPLTAATVAAVHRLTGGNPLYVRELVAAASESGAIRTSPSGSTLDTIPAASSRLIDLVEARLRRLRPEERAALHRIAVVGEASVDELAEVVDPSVLEALEDRGLITASVDGEHLRIEVAHPLHTEVIRSMESSARARRIRAEHADVLRRRGAASGRDLLRLATWALDGIGTADADESTQAARDAAAAGDFDLAQRLAAAAFDARPSVAAAEFLATRQLAAGDFDAMKDHIPRWEELVSTEPDRANFEEIVTQARYWRDHDSEAIDGLVGGFEAWTDAAARSQVQAAAAALLVSSGRIDEAVALAESIGELPPGPTAVLTAMTLGHGWRSQARPVSAEASVSAALDFYRSISVDVYLLSSVAMAGLHLQTLADSGRFDDLDRIVADREVAWRDMGATSNLALVDLARGYSWLLRGEYDRAVEMAVSAEAGFEINRHPGMRRWAMTLRALAFAEPAKLDDAERVLAALDGERDHPAQIFAATLSRARAWVEHHRGRSHRAIEYLEAGGDRAIATGNRAGLLECVHDLARQGHVERATERLDEVPLDDVEGPLHGARIAHVRALAARDVAALGRCVESFDELSAPHLAAEAATAAALYVSTSVEAKRWMNQAAMRRRSDRAGGGSGIARRFDEAGLTPREREVALLAAEGRTSREIAERLGNSHRTIDAHLGRIYTKLGIEGRLDLVHLERASSAAPGGPNGAGPADSRREACSPSPTT